MNRQDRKRLRELANKAELYPDQESKKWVGSYRIHIEGSTQKIVSHGVYDDESYPYCCLGSGATPEITEYIAATNPDVLIQLLDKLDAADELAQEILAARLQLKAAKIVILAVRHEYEGLPMPREIYEALENYDRVTKAGESEGDDG